MKPATRPRRRDEERLMLVDARAGTIASGAFGSLGASLRAGDVLVVNDAATLPASVGFEHEGARAELRLLFDGADRSATAFVLGAGDASMKTEDRGPPPKLRAGDRLSLDGGLEAVVLSVDPESDRLVKVQLSGSAAAVLGALYRAGKPVRYAYLETALELWDVQTVYAGRPWASEMPSAGRPLSWAMLGALRHRGVEIVRITHGAGLSSSGDARLDERLPLEERYSIEEETCRVIERARARRGRIVAVGTSVVRALESAALPDGRVVAGEGRTTLRIGGETTLRVVDAILTGMHEAGTSHFELLEAFADRDLLLAAIERGDRDGYLLHELGDSMLLFARHERRAA